MVTKKYSEGDLTRQPIRRCRKVSLDMEPNEESTNEPEESNLYPDIEEDLEECEKSSKKNEFSCPWHFGGKEIGKTLINYWLHILCIVIVVCGVLFVVHSSSYGKQTEALPQAIEQLFNHFKGQTMLTKKILLSALKEVVNETSSPTNPAVITVLASPGTTSLAKRFCEYLVKSLVSKNYLMIDEQLYGQESDEDKIKLKIDDEISSAVDDSHLNAVIVDQIEKIPVKATMIFHGLCDETYPRFKRVIYMFILTLDENLELDASVKQIDSAAMQQFKRKWQSHPDVVDSLLSRLTVNVIHFHQKS